MQAGSFRNSLQGTSKKLRPTRAGWPGCSSPGYGSLACQPAIADAFLLLATSHPHYAGSSCEKQK